VNTFRRNKGINKTPVDVVRIDYPLDFGQAQQARKTIPVEMKEREDERHLRVQSQHRLPSMERHRSDSFPDTFSLQHGIPESKKVEVHINQNAVNGQIEGLQLPGAHEGLNMIGALRGRLQHPDHLIDSPHTVGSNQDVYVPAWPIAHMLEPALLGSDTFESRHLDPALTKGFIDVAKDGPKSSMTELRLETLRGETVLKLGIDYQLPQLYLSPDESYHTVLESRLNEPSHIFNQRERTSRRQLDKRGVRTSHDLDGLLVYDVHEFPLG
jgi:hypothetical protein